MMLATAPEAPSPISAEEPVVRLLRDLVHERTGVYFDAHRLDAMLGKLEPRALATGCRSYLEYYYILKYDAQGATEWRRVMDAFSVQETYFWRETDQLRLLVEQIVPRWFAQTKRPLRIWSAACATGEEPYSIAIALREAGWGNKPIQILATDSSESALAKARSRIYRERAFRALPDTIRDRYFDPSDDGFRLRPQVGNAVTFRWANLMDLSEDSTEADVIFCRNVFIYFSPAAITRVLASFAQRLPANAKLFVGASESLHNLTEDFAMEEIGGAFVYVRKPIN